MVTQLRLTPCDRGRALSLDEFQSAHGEEGYHYELIDGKLEVSPLPDLSHECLRDWLLFKLRSYSRQHPDVFNALKAPARVFVPDRPGITIPEPDIAVYQDFPFERPLAERRWQDVSPLLVVEILSPDTADKDLERNRDLYVQVPSIREYWILDPRRDANRPNLIVYRRRGSRWQRPIEIAPGESYSTRLLPEFVLVLEDVSNFGAANESNG